jgi:hypothetical protein
MEPSSGAEVVAVTRANNKYAIHFTGDLFGTRRSLAAALRNQKDGGPSF